MDINIIFVLGPSGVGLKSQATSSSGSFWQEAQNRASTSSLFLISRSSISTSQWSL